MLADQPAGSRGKPIELISAPWVGFPMASGVMSDILRRTQRDPETGRRFWASCVAESTQKVRRHRRLPLWWRAGNVLETCLQWRLMSDADGGFWCSVVAATFRWSSLAYRQCEAAAAAKGIGWGGMAVGCPSGEATTTTATTPTGAVAIVLCRARRIVLRASKRVHFEHCSATAGKGQPGQPM